MQKLSDGASSVCVSCLQAVELLAGHDHMATPVTADRLLQCWRLVGFLIFHDVTNCLPVPAVSVCVLSVSLCMLFTGSATVGKARSRDHSYNVFSGTLNPTHSLTHPVMADGPLQCRHLVSPLILHNVDYGNYLMVPEVSVYLVCRQWNRWLATIM